MLNGFQKVREMKKCGRSLDGGGEWMLWLRF